MMKLFKKLVLVVGFATVGLVTLITLDYLIPRKPSQAYIYEQDKALQTIEKLSIQIKNRSHPACAGLKLYSECFTKVLPSFPPRSYPEVMQYVKLATDISNLDREENNLGKTSTSMLFADNLMLPFESILIASHRIHAFKTTQQELLNDMMALEIVHLNSSKNEILGTCSVLLNAVYEGVLKNRLPAESKKNREAEFYFMLLERYKALLNKNFKLD